jgi:hypothetical protein
MARMSESLEARRVAMPSRWLCRLAVLATLVIAAQIPADASMADPADPAQIVLTGVLPVTAAEAESPGCTEWATGPSAQMDLWRFGLLGSGRFRTISLSFLTADGAAYTRIVQGDVSVTTEAGASLLGGTATVSGDASSFVLVLACPATVAGARAPIVPRLGAVTGAGERPDASARPQALAAGADVGATVTMGCALVLAGALLLIVRRHPRGRHRARRAMMPHDAEDIRHAVITRG